MDLENLNTLEDRLEKPAYLLFLVVVLLLLIIGFVNLLDHTSANTGVFGVYSVPYFGVIVGYGIVTLIWASLLRRPNDNAWLTRLVGFVQKRPLYLFVYFFGVTAVIWTLFNINHWIFYPALQATTLALLALATGILVFHGWGNSGPIQLWRKIAVILLALVIVAEIVFQLLTMIGALPSITVTTNSFAPYSRIYHTEEGSVNRMANEDGWNYPEFQLAEGSKRIILIGDGNIQAIQVQPEQNVGVILQDMLTTGETDEPGIEVLSLGYPDYGPGLYLDPALFDFAIDAYQPDEIIAFFDLRNDFQTAEAPNADVIFFETDEQGNVDIHPESTGVRHDVQHQVLHVYEGFQPVRFIQSHYMTPRLINKLVNPPAARASATNDLGLANSFVFNEATNDEAMAIATSLIKNAADHLAEQNIKFSLVTIPVFNDGFYAQNNASNWQTQFGEANLLLPEQEIRTAAAEKGIPFLALGTYFAAQDYSTTDIQDLYFSAGRGHFTPEGHEMLGTAVYNCFIAQTVTSDAGCDAR
jgi:hypothetical protein